MLDSDFYLALYFCGIIMLVVLVNWLYKCKNILRMRIVLVEKKLIQMEKEPDPAPNTITKLINSRLSPMEQSLLDMSIFTQVIDIIDMLDFFITYSYASSTDMLTITNSGKGSISKIGKHY